MNEVPVFVMVGRAGLNRARFQNPLAPLKDAESKTEYRGGNGRGALIESTSIKSEGDGECGGSKQSEL